MFGWHHHHGGAGFPSINQAINQWSGSRQPLADQSETRAWLGIGQHWLDHSCGRNLVFDDGLAHHLCDQRQVERACAVGNPIFYRLRALLTQLSMFPSGTQSEKTVMRTQECSGLNYFLTIEVKKGINIGKKIYIF